MEENNCRGCEDIQLWRPQNDVVLLGADLLDWPEHAYDFLVYGSRAFGLKAGLGAFSSS